MTDISVFASTEDWAFARWRGAYLYVWRKKTTPEGVDALRRCVLNRPATPGEPGVFFGMIEEGAIPPDTENRKALAQVVSETMKGIVHASAGVFEGDGFRAATVRFVGTAMTMLARQPFPHKMCKTPQEAAEYLNSQLAAQKLAQYPAAELAAALQALRKAPLSSTPRS